MENSMVVVRTRYLAMVFMVLSKKASEGHNSVESDILAEENFCEKCIVLPTKAPVLWISKNKSTNHFIFQTLLLTKF
jgi:hypothetical protein